MKIRKILTTLIFLGVAGAIIWWSYPVIKDRYFAPEEEVKIDEDQERDDLFVPKETQEEVTQEEENVSTKPELTSSDCDNECSRFYDEDLKYCQEVCGLGEQSEDETDCESKTGLEKDYCLKDKGIKEKDFKYCNEVLDEKIKETCQNRVTEEILDNSNLN